MKIKYYLHSDKETNYDKAKELNLTKEAADAFAYCCYEVEMTLDVSEDGAAVLTHVQGVPLLTPVQVT
jgi:hypothetical protein